MTGLLRMREITATVAAEHGCALADLLGRRRFKHLGHARQEAYSRIRELWNGHPSSPYSLPAIGRFFGRDHATILWGIRAHRERPKPTAKCPLCGR